MKRFSCVIFDLDGTISQTNELIFATFNHVIGKYLGKTFTTQEIVATFGPPEEIAIERLVGSERIAPAMTDFYRFYEEHHDAMATAHAGIPELLRLLKSRGVYISLFTGKGRRTTLITLEKFGILQYFDLVVTGSDVVRHKPSGEGIQKALDASGVAPAAALMVGDAVADIKAARETGVAIASVLWDSYGKGDVLSMGVEDVFHSVGEFTRWLEPRAGEGVPLA
jgi:HAD superfamily hydrolase (TIGR01509 family)